MRFFHHGAALDRIGEFVADQYSIFHVFVRGDGVDVAGHSGNGSRRNAALGNFVTLCNPRSWQTADGAPLPLPLAAGDKFSAIDGRG